MEGNNRTAIARSYTEISNWQMTILMEDLINPFLSTAGNRYSASVKNLTNSFQ